MAKRNMPEKEIKTDEVRKPVVEEPKPDVKSGTVECERLNIRQEASLNSAILGVLEKGAPVRGEVLGNGWIKLSTRKGFVKAEYVKLK